MRRYREAYADALAAVEQFNARLSPKKSAWFWPTIAAALTSKHHWLVIACDSCDTIIDLDLTVKLPIGIAWTTFGVALQRLGLASDILVEQGLLFEQFRVNETDFHAQAAPQAGLLSHRKSNS